MFEYEELYPEDAVKKAYVCEGLSHPARWLIVKILKENRGKIAIAELMEILRRDYDYRQNYARLKHHIDKMERAGIVKIHYPPTRKKLTEVELLLDVDISISEYKKEADQA